MLKLKSVNGVLISGLIALVVCIGGANIFWLQNSLFHSNLEIQTTNMERLVRSYASSLQEYLDGGKQLVNVLANQQVIRDSLQGKNNPHGASLLLDLAKEVDGIERAIVIDETEKILLGSSSSGEDLAGSSLEGSVFSSMDTGVASGDSVISKTVLKADQGAGDLIYIYKYIENAKGTSLGKVAILLDLGKYACIATEQQSMGQDCVSIYDSEGNRICPNADQGKTNTSPISGSTLKTILKNKNGLLHFESDGENKLMAYRLISEAGWIVAVTFDSKHIDGLLSYNRNSLIILWIVNFILLVSISSLFLKNFFQKQIKNITAYAQQITSGNLSAELSGTYRYELLMLADAIQNMVEELKTKLGFSQGVLQGMLIPCALFDARGKIVWVNDELRELAGEKRSVEQLKGTTSGDIYNGDPGQKTMVDRAIQEQTKFDLEKEHHFPSGKNSILRIRTTAFYDLDNKLLGAVSNLIDLTEIRTQQNQIQEQNAKISRTASEAENISQNLASAAEELSAQIEQASKGAISQRDRMAETATAMNQMNASVLEVARNASEAAQVTSDARREASLGATNLGDLIRTIGEVHTQAVSLKDSMSNLGEQAQDIGNVMDVITDIADQTNLLALNAAIEAARAGEAGRGFAVVADEVRKLAEKTMSATKEVGNAIANIQSVAGVNIQATEKAVRKIAQSTELAGKSGEVLNAIVLMMDNAASQVSGIAAAAEEQSSTSEQINHSTEEVNQLSQEASDAMTLSSNAVQDVARMAAKLTQLIEAMVC